MFILQMWDWRYIGQQGYLDIGELMGIALSVSGQIRTTEAEREEMMEKA